MSADKKISNTFSKPVFLVVTAALGLMFLASGFTAIGFVVAHQLYSHNGGSTTFGFESRCRHQRQEPFIRNWNGRS